MSTIIRRMFELGRENVNWRCIIEIDRKAEGVPF